MFQEHLDLNDLVLVSAGKYGLGLEYYNSGQIMFSIRNFIYIIDWLSRVTKKYCNAMCKWISLINFIV